MADVALLCLHLLTFMQVDAGAANVLSAEDFFKSLLVYERLTGSKANFRKDLLSPVLTNTFSSRYHKLPNCYLLKWG